MSCLHGRLDTSSLPLRVHTRERTCIESTARRVRCSTPRLTTSTDTTTAGVEERFRLGLQLTPESVLTPLFI